MGASWRERLFTRPPLYRVAVRRKRRWKEGKRDAKAVAVEELGGDGGKAGGGGDEIHLEEHGRGGHGGVAKAGARNFLHEGFSSELPTNVIRAIDAGFATSGKKINHISYAAPSWLEFEM